MIALMGIKHCGKTSVGKALADLTGAPFFDIDDEIERMCGMSVRELYATRGADAFKAAEADAVRAVLKRAAGPQKADTVSDKASAALKAASAEKTDSSADQTASAQKAACALADKASPASKADGAVIATGGGISDNQDALASLTAAGCRLVYLAVDEKTACDRILAEAEKTGSLPAYIQKEHPASEQDVRAVFNGFYCRRTKAYEALCAVKVDVSGKTPEAISAEIAALRP